MKGRRRCIPGNARYGAANGSFTGRSNAVLTKRGYRRITSGPDRHKYEHRAVIEKLLVSPISYLMLEWGGKIPADRSVHHIDWKGAHNCNANLMLLDQPLHNALTSQHRGYVFYRKNESPHHAEFDAGMDDAPAWVLDAESFEGEGEDDGGCIGD